jgi:hypothetical protein
VVYWQQPVDSCSTQPSCSAISTRGTAVVSTCWCTLQWWHCWLRCPGAALHAMCQLGGWKHNSRYVLPTQSAGSWSNKGGVGSSTSRWVLSVCVSIHVNNPKLFSCYNRPTKYTEVVMYSYFIKPLICFDPPGPLSSSVQHKQQWSTVGCTYMVVHLRRGIIK